MFKRFLTVTIIAAVLLSAGCTADKPAVSASGVKDITNTTAWDIVNDMRVGWNLGNTLDAYGDTPEGFSWLGDGTFAGTSVTEMETAWLGEGAVAATQELFDTLKEAGFNTVRIPVTWYKAADAANDYKIREDWMARVKEIVDFAVVNDMYIILNTHHEESLFKVLDREMKEFDSLRAFELIWKQIAEVFRDYDEKLIFEGLNEPRTRGSRSEWVGGTREERLNINTYHQLFVDTVRATGGNNAYRVLMVAPYGANSETAAMKDLKIPKDTVPDRIIVSIHAYTPWEFALRNDEGAVDTWSRNNRSDTSPIHHMFNRIYDAFIHDGIPVIMGEMGAMNRNNTEDRADWAEFYVSTAKKFGIPCIWWDNGEVEGDAELFGLIDRATNEFFYPEIVEALMKATHPMGARGYAVAAQRQADPDEEVEETEEEPEPYAGSEIRILRADFDTVLSLIPDDETELTSELRAFVNKFLYPLVPEDVIVVGARTLIDFYRDYFYALMTEEELAELYMKYNAVHIMSVENLDLIFNEIFSKEAGNIITDYHEYADENGIIAWGPFGIHGGYRLILMEQSISDDAVELYFYNVYSYDEILVRKGYVWREDGNGVEYIDTTEVGRWDYDAEEQQSYAILYEDLLDTLDIVKYTFVLEDGKWKILSIESVA